MDFKKDITAFDQKQKDLVVRALIYYRKKKYGTSVDKGVGPDNKIFDFEDMIDSKERNERLVAELTDDNREKTAALHTLQISLQGKTEALEKSISRNKGLERETFDAKAQLELYKRELADKNSQMYFQAEKILKLQESEKELKQVKAELKAATDSLKLVYCL